MVIHQVGEYTLILISFLSFLLQAARLRCTVGEISDAMEEIFKRHVASDLSLTGAYKSEFGEDNEITQVIDRVEVHILTEEIFVAEFNFAIQREKICEFRGNLISWLNNILQSCWWRKVTFQ